LSRRRNPPFTDSAKAADYASLIRPTALKRDEIAARQLHALNEFRRPRDKKLRLADVKAMFLKMRDQG
jgi:hypothetical protein